MTAKTEEITIQVAPEAAKVYRSASEEDRRKMDLLLSLRLTDVTRPDISLKEVMQEISRSARKRGLTEETLQSLLEE